VEKQKKKAVAKTEAPVICYVENGSISVVGYHRTLLLCASVKEAIIGVLSIYHVCSIDYHTKHRLFMHFLEFVLTGDSSHAATQGKKAKQLIKALKL